MASIWDPDLNTYYDFSPSDLADAGGDQEELLRKLRERQAMIHSKPAEVPWEEDKEVRPLDQIPAKISAQPEDKDGFWEGVWEGAKKSAPGRATGAVMDFLDRPIPGAARYAKFAHEHPYLSMAISPGLHMAIEGGGRVLGSAKRALPAAAEEYGEDHIKDAILADESLSDVERVRQLYAHEDPSLADRWGRAIMTGALTLDRPDVQEEIEEEQLENMQTVAEIPTIVDAAALGLTPWTGGASNSRLALKLNKVARAVDALDAAMGARDVAEGRPISGAIRIAGAGSGAVFGKMEDLTDVPQGLNRGPFDVPPPNAASRVDDLLETGEARGLDETELQELDDLERMLEPKDTTVQPVNITDELTESEELAEMDLHERVIRNALEEAETQGDAAAVEQLTRDLRAAEIDREARFPREPYEAPTATQAGVEVRASTDNPVDPPEVSGLPAKPLDVEQQRLTQEIAEAATPEEAEVLTRELADYNQKQDRARRWAELETAKLKDPENPEIQRQLDELKEQTRAEATARETAELDEIENELLSIRSRQEAGFADGADEARVLELEERAKVLDEMRARRSDAVDADADVAAESAKLTDEQIEAARVKEGIEEQLSFKEWVAKNYPDGAKGKSMGQIAKEYRAYQKKLTTGESGGPTPPKSPGEGKRGKKPAEPKTPAKVIDLGRKLGGRTLANLEYAMPEVGERLRKFINTWERWASKDIYQSKRLKARARALGDDAEGRIIKWLDGEEVTWGSPEEMKVALEYRAMLRNVANIAEQHDVLIGRRTAYFPHIFEKDWTGPILPSKTGRRAKPKKGRESSQLEKSRETGREDWIDNLDIVENYLDESYRRISESAFLGKNHEKLLEVRNKYEVRGRDQQKYIEGAINAITQVQGSSELGSKIRYYTALLDLSRAAIYQPGQITATAAVGGVTRSAIAAAKLLTSPTFRKAMKEGAEISGATRPDVMLDTISNTGKFHGKFMWGIPTVDRAMRVHAYAVGDMIYTAARNGNADAKKTMEFLGMGGDTKLYNADEVGVRLSNKTQFRTGPSQKPLWATDSEWGKFAYQYSHFAYQWGILVKDLFQRKEWGKIAKLVTVGGVAGELVADVRAMTHLHDPFFDSDMPQDIDDPEAYMKAVLVRSSRVPVSSPLARGLQNLMMVGGAGVFFDRFADAMIRPDSVEDIGNIFPASRRPAQLFKDVRRGEPVRGLGKQLPFVGPYFYHDRSSASPGTGGTRRSRRPRRSRRRRR